MAFDDNDNPWDKKNTNKDKKNTKGNKDNGDANAPDNDDIDIDSPWSAGSSGKGGKQSSGGWSKSQGGKRANTNFGGFGGGSSGKGGNDIDIEDILAKGQASFRNFLPGGLNNKLIIFLILIGVGIWMSTGIYRVGPAQQGVELIFGKYHDTTQSGLHFNFPSPIGEVYLPNVDRQRRLNVGFRSDELAGSSGLQSDIAEESNMLTSDENIVDLDFTVFWRIGEPRNYLFAVRNPEATIKVVAESAMREVIGQTTFDLAVTRGRQTIETKTLEAMQNILDSYETGVIVERVELQASDPPAEVIDAFNDVQRARQDRDRLRNQAEAYANSIVPEARGIAERMLREAEAYKERLIAEAEGEAQRFLSVYETYVDSPEVTRQRMYLEVLGDVYRDSNKIIIDPDISGEGGQGIVPYLPLNEIGNRGSNRQESNRNQNNNDNNPQ